MASRRIKFRLPAWTGPQASFWASEARYRAFVGGVGSGKTLAGCVEILRQPAGSIGMVTAPTYTMLRDATVTTFLGLTRPYGLLRSFHKQEMRAELVNGTSVLFRTADGPDRLRGPNLSWWYGDEASLHGHDVYLIMIGRLRLPGARAWLTFTPRGKGWLFDQFVTRATPNHHLTHATTASNTFLPPEFLDGLADVYSPTFARQELGGEWIDATDDRLIPDGWLDRAFAAPRPDGLDGGPRSLALDIAKGDGGDRTVALVGDDLGLLEAVADNTIGLPSAAALAGSLSRRWGVPHDRITYDAGGWAGPDMGRFLEEVGILDALPYRGNAAGGTRFANRRARAAWRLRQRLDPDRPRPTAAPPAGPPGRTPSLAERRRSAARAGDAGPTHGRPAPYALPPAVLGSLADPLRRELSELRYRHDASKIAMERKQDMVARLGRSPDLADAMIMLANITDADPIL